jgi:hypothetical protein
MPIGHCEREAFMQPCNSDIMRFILTHGLVSALGEAVARLNTAINRLIYTPLVFASGKLSVGGEVVLGARRGAVRHPMMGSRVVGRRAGPHARPDWI